MPVDCMKAYMVVEPTKRKPSAFSALLMRFDASVSVGHAFDAGQTIDDRAAFDESPHEARERHALVRCQISLGIRDRGFDLGAIADDAFVVHQPRDVAFGEARDARGIEIVEGFAEVFALSQDGDPGKPCLKTFERHLLE